MRVLHRKRQMTFFRSGDNSPSTGHFTHKALPPAMDWKVKEPLTAPENLRVENNMLQWEHPTAERFTVYAYPMGLDLATAQKTNE